jgi:peptidoglycan/xylan/chitin deacetylase (PgdA/CDA1 family)
MHSVFTSSWDDGHPNDVRVADLLTQYSLPGTFFIPTSNSEGMPVLNGIDLRSISEEFEIGSHTLSHIYLNSVEALEANRQIVEGKSRLEQDLGFQVHGFCYPGGKQNSAIRGMVEKAGFFYARGVTNLDTAPTDRFRMPTTIQFFPHPRKVFVKNYLTRGGLNRYPLLPVVLRHSSLKDQLSSAMRLISTDGVF